MVQKISISVVRGLELENSCTSWPTDAWFGSNFPFLRMYKSLVRFMGHRGRRNDKDIALRT